MERRDFLTTSALAMTALTVGSCQLATDKQEMPVKLKNWIWLGPDEKATFKEWVERFDKLKKRGIDAALVEVFQGSKAFYQSSFLPMGEPILEKVLEAGNQTGLEIHAWMWTMPCLIPEIISEHPEWYNVNAKGESSATSPAYVDYYKFLCPSRPETRAFITKRVQELSGFNGLAGIHLDYVRHPDAILPKGLWGKYNLVQDRVYPEFDYCYCDHCRSSFSKQTGVDPIEIQNPSEHEEWMKYRWNAVTELVNNHLVPEARNKNKLITAAVFPGPSLAKNMVRQDWGNWDLDAFMPMLYHSFYEKGPEWVNDLTAEGVNTVGANRLFSGIYVPGITTAREFTATLKAAERGGATGVSLFGMKDDYWRRFERWVKR